MREVIRAPNAGLTMAVTMEHLKVPEDLENQLAQESISLMIALLYPPVP